MKENDTQQPNAQPNTQSSAADLDLLETKLSSNTVYQGNFLVLKRDHIRLPNGKPATREYMVHPGAVVILPLFEDGDVLIEKQFRYPLNRVFIEYPAGKLESQPQDLLNPHLQSETALDCAQRELREETGYTAKKWTKLTKIHPAIAYSTEYLDFFLAEELSPGEKFLDEEEFLLIEKVSLRKMLDWIKSGIITDAKTMIATFWLEKIVSGDWEINRND